MESKDLALIFTKRVVTSIDFLTDVKKNYDAICDCITRDIELQIHYFGIGGSYPPLDVMRGVVLDDLRLLAGSIFKYVSIENLEIIVEDSFEHMKKRNAGISDFPPVLMPDEKPAADIPAEDVENSEPVDGITVPPVRIWLYQLTHGCLDDSAVLAGFVKYYLLYDCSMHDVKREILFHTDYGAGAEVTAMNALTKALNKLLSDLLGGGAGA